VIATFSSGFILALFGLSSAATSVLATLIGRSIADPEFPEASLC
jgi:hypothetical protein